MSLPYAKVIVNPVAGARSTIRKWPRISRLLSHVGLSFDYQYTEGVGHAIELAREATGSGYNYIVAVGGDGTVNEVANGILHYPAARDMTLGVISTGTGSDFGMVDIGRTDHLVDNWGYDIGTFRSGRGLPGSLQIIFIHYQNNRNIWKHQSSLVN